MDVPSMQLLLASKSPRRRQLLASIDIPVTTVEIDVEEHLSSPVPAAEVAERLALLKAQGYTQPLEEGQVLVAADTVVVHRDSVLGKPHSEQEAYAMLRALSGDAHTVYTGVCLRSSRDQRLFTEATRVWFNPLNDDELHHYIDTYRPYDKAGAYGIQEWIGLIGISRIEGCYYNVMGLPVARLYQELRQLQMEV